MTGDVLLRIASQDTLEAVRDRIGETGDTGGTYNSGTLTSKANAALLALGGVNNGIDGLNNRLDGVVTPYGKGTYGDLIVGPDLAWPSQDGFNRYVLHTKSMTIPEGVTLTPPDKCDGLYILSQGDVTINGVIDVKGKRKTFTEDLQLAPTINVGSQEFVLARGGYAPKGGACGEGGKVTSAKNNAPAWSDVLAICASMSPINSASGNVNGGGTGSYCLMTGSTEYRYDTSGISQNTVALRAISDNAPGALVIIAKGTVTINGNILASCADGIYATDGQQARSGKVSSTITMYYAGLGGSGAIPPSGGGAITIICDKLVVNGSIDTNGKTFQSPDGKDNNSQYVTGNAKAVIGGQGGFGGTFISTAGEIKVYTGVSE